MAARLTWGSGSSPARKMSTSKEPPLQAAAAGHRGTGTQVEAQGEQEAIA